MPRVIGHQKKSGQLKGIEGSQPLDPPVSPEKILGFAYQRGGSA
jgi:hypothetical protein